MTPFGVILFTSNMCYCGYMMQGNSKLAEHLAETVYCGESIDLKKVQEGIRHYSFLNRDHPLVVKLLDDQYVVLTKFGSVTFWNVENKLRQRFLSEIKPFVKSKKEHYSYDENTEVYDGAEETKITFDKIYLTKLNTDHIKIISYVLSQSVALERYEDDLEKSLSEIGTIVENLRSTGKAMLSQSQLLMQIGKALSVKQTVVVHLALLDKPEEVWESPDLEVLYNRMNAEYELQDRFDVLNDKINYLSDVSELLMNFLAEKRSEFLEIIIIVLILIEIILWFVPPFPEILNSISKLF